MKSLTFEGNFCDISKCAYLMCPYDHNCTQKQVWERLKQFEDAFGTPEKAERVKLAFMGKSVYEIKEFGGVPLARLIELAEADKDGRVVVLPCKLGAKVYRIWYKIADYPDEPEMEIVETKFGEGCREDFGKTVFLTREEAEKALAEMKGETEK